MRNLTIHVDEDSYRLARMAAAERDTSVSNLVREYFRSLSPAGNRRDLCLRQLFEAMDAVEGPSSASGRERDRSKLYER